MKKVRLKSNVNLAINLFLIVVLGIASFFLTSNIINNSNSKSFVMNYKIENSLDYKVYILNNPYYSVPFLEMNKQYPISIISNIKYTIATKYKSSKSTKLKYTYKVVGKMIGETVMKDSDNEEVWNKEYVLIEEKTKEVDSNVIDIKEEIDIDFPKYEKLMEEYKKSFAISMEAYYKVEYTIRIEDITNNVTKELVTSSEIPLLESTVKMIDNTPKNINSNIYKSKGFSILEISLIIIDAILYLLIIILIIKSSKINFISGYLEKLNKILKLYGDIIIKVESLPECNDLEIVELKDFNSLVDLEQELRKPIMYAKIDESLNVFAIYTSTFIYRYVFDEEEYVWENED